MAVNAASTDQQVHDEYHNNASYDTNNSVTEAGLFVAACRQLLLRLPQMASLGGSGLTETLQTDPGVLERQIRIANDWIANNSATRPAGHVGHFEISPGFRGGG